MEGENFHDERSNPVELYRFNVFLPIIDQISSSLKEREELYRTSNFFHQIPLQSFVIIN